MSGASGQGIAAATGVKPHATYPQWIHSHLAGIRLSKLYWVYTVRYEIPALNSYRDCAPLTTFEKTHQPVSTLHSDRKDTGPMSTNMVVNIVGCVHGVGSSNPEKTLALALALLR